MCEVVPDGIGRVHCGLAQLEDKTITRILHAAGIGALVLSAFFAYLLLGSLLA